MWLIVLFLIGSVACGISTRSYDKEHPKGVRAAYWECWPKKKTACRGNGRTVTDNTQEEYARRARELQVRRWKA